MPINLAAAAFGGVVGTVLGGALGAGVAALRGEPVTGRVVAAGAARGGATGAIGGLTFGLGLIPGALGGATGSVVGEYLAAAIGRTRVTRKDLAVAAVSGLVGAALLSELAPARTLFAPPLRVTVGSAAVSGAGAGAAGQTAGNLLHDRPLLENVPTATALGGATGAFVGAAARGVQELQLARLRATTARPASTRAPEPPPSRPDVPEIPLEAMIARSALRNLEAAGTPRALEVLQALRDGRLVLHINEAPPVGRADSPVNLRVAVPYGSTQPETLRWIVEEGLKKLAFQKQLAAVSPPRSKGMVAALSDPVPGAPAPQATPGIEDFVRSGVFESLEEQGTPLAARIWRALADGRLVLRVNRDASAVAAARPNEIDIDIPYGSPLDDRQITLGRVIALAGPKLEAPR